MADTRHADLLVIGAGPGGYAAAFRAADLGRTVTLADPRPTLGGVCLNEGCIPSKALLHAAEVIRQSREMSDWGVALGAPKIDLDALRAKKDGIVGQLVGGLGQIAKRRKVTTLRATATFSGANSVTLSGEDAGELTFDQAIIAAGSAPIRLPGWPDDPRIMDSTGALELREIPKRLAVVGGGIIGLEMATVYAALGSKVTILELADQIAPGADAQSAKILRKAMEDQGCVIHTGTKVAEARALKTALKLRCEGAHEGELAADAVIMSVGRRAQGDLLNAQAAGITPDKRGEIAVDAQCRTARSHIFAIGDVTGGPMLAHRATHQGKVAAETASGHPAAFDGTYVPSVAYTDPELAWAGLTPDAAKAQGIKAKTSSFPWAASGRNLASGGHDGLTTLVYDPDTHRLLGASIVGRHAGELIGEMTLAMESGARLEDLALTIHAHPTLTETSAFAAERALGTLTDL
jgi:dihydrolipoamide dehydrogenase